MTGRPAQTAARRLLRSAARPRRPPPRIAKPDWKGQAEPSYTYKFLQNPPSVTIIGCPFSGGQGRAGVELGPNRLMAAGLGNQLKDLGWHVYYEDRSKFVDIPYNQVPSYGETARGEQIERLPDPDIGAMKNPRLVSAVNHLLSGVVEEAVRHGTLPLTLGGDHSLAMGTVSGVKAVHPSSCLIWVDAHADINTPQTTDSGNLHGCPVSFLLGLAGKGIQPFEWLKPCLLPKDIVYIGLRDVDRAEKKILREAGILAFSMHEVDRHGISQVLDMALEHVNPTRDRPIHLSFDIDALDPTVAPSTGTPVRGGLTFREGHYITEVLAETGCLVAVDIMEVNPSLLDSTSVESTVAVGCSLARAAMGETLL